MINFAKKIKKRFSGKKTENLGAYLRAQAALAIGQVIDNGSSLRSVLQQRKNQFESPQELAQFKEICFGTIRWYYRLEAILNTCLNTPLEKKNNDIKYLICNGLYQLTEMRTAHHAVVNETVQAARLLNKPWACKLVNKMLRQFIRNQENILKKIEQEPAQWYAYPQWLLDKLQQDWPENWQQIVENSNHKPPLSLRINQQKTSPIGYVSLLKKEKISAQLCEDYPHAVIITTPKPTSELPGFDHGLFSVQDLSGQNVASILDLKPNQNVLDACAAPGSKTSHIIETEPNLNKIVAIDIDAERLLRVKQNFIRLSLPQEKLKMVLEDATHTKQWWDGTLFDRILLDAPCSATGVIRRHPDIKILRRETDIEKQVQVQLMLLKSMSSLLAPGGLLLYTTCSVLKQENEKTIHRFLKENKQMHSKKINVANAINLKYGCQLLPSKKGSDGFYFALLHKK
jgi:16S rRNA (cytosine967-C5)-methyltransferase